MANRRSSFLVDEAHLEAGGLTMIVKREDNLYVFEVDLQHPAADEFTAVAVARLLMTRSRRLVKKTISAFGASFP